jgi:hypothetical protein
MISDPLMPNNLLMRYFRVLIAIFLHSVARFFCAKIKLAKKMPKVPKLPKMPKAVRPRGSRQVNVFYLFYENRNSRQVVISLF